MNLYDTLLGLLCRLGFHDFRVIETTYGFGDSGDIEKIECRRCGVMMVREQN